MEKRVVLGVFFNEFTGQDGNKVTLMRVSHMSADEPGFDENWDGYLVETMNVQQDQIDAVKRQVRDVPGVYNLDLRRAAAKTRSGGDGYRIQVARMAFVAPVTIQASELVGAAK